MHALDSIWESLKRDFDSALSRRMRDLNHVFHRLRHYQDEAQWLAALQDGLALGMGRFAIFMLEGSTLRLRGKQDMPLAGDAQFPLASAHAFKAVAETREPLTALSTPGELGLFAEAAGSHNDRAHLYPITNGDRVVAIVYADASRSLDTDVVELVTSMASTVLERQANQTKQLQITPASVPVTASVSGQAPASLPAWAALDDSARVLHHKAQRFARKAVAEMELARPEACRAGREQNNLYLLLQGEIDKARDTYSKQFMRIPSMVDYLHLELTRAAGGDEQQLGADYPGHLV